MPSEVRRPCHDSSLFEVRGIGETAVGSQADRAPPGRFVRQIRRGRRRFVANLDPRLARRPRDVNGQLAARLARDLDVDEGGPVRALAKIAAGEPRPEELHERMHGQRTGREDDVGERTLYAKIARQGQIEGTRIPFEQLAVGQMVGGQRLGARRRGRRGGRPFVASSRSARADAGGRGYDDKRSAGPERPRRESHEDPPGADRSSAARTRGTPAADHSSTAAQELIRVGAVGVGREIENGFSAIPFDAPTPPTSPTSENEPGVKLEVT